VFEESRCLSSLGTHKLFAIACQSLPASPSDINNASLISVMIIIYAAGSDLASDIFTLLTNHDPPLARLPSLNKLWAPARHPSKYVTLCHKRFSSLFSWKSSRHLQCFSLHVPLVIVYQDV
jgi:hypothetical protein